MALLYKIFFNIFCTDILRLGLMLPVLPGSSTLI